MPFRIQQEGEEHGQAGETSGFTPTGKYNFANLYQLNRQDDQIKQAQSGFDERAGEIDRAMHQAGNEILRPGQPGQSGQERLGWAKQASESLANDTRNFSPANQAMKNGASPYQAGILGFYGGSGNLDKIHQYGNIYAQTLKNASGLESFTPVKPFGKPDYGHLPPQRADGMSQEEADAKTGMGQGQRGDRMQNDSTLIWGLKQGNITTEEYYAALRAGPGSKIYNEIMSKANHG